MSVEQQIDFKSLYKIYSRKLFLTTAVPNKQAIALKMRQKAWNIVAFHGPWQKDKKL